MTTVGGYMSTHRQREIKSALLTIDEAIRYCRTSRSKFYEMLKEGDGPAVVKFGRSIRFNPADLDEWLNSLKVPYNAPASR